MRKILVLGSQSYGAPFVKLGKTSYDIKELLDSPEDFSLVVFTGGEDVHPYLYGSKDYHNVCCTSSIRDSVDHRVFKFCADNSIKMAGICRGLQFLNVMSGGKLYQHVNNHGIRAYHPAYFLYMDRHIQVNSLHHQMIKPPNNAMIIAVSDPSRSDIYLDWDGTIYRSEPGISQNVTEVEAAVFPETLAFGVQYHPEMMHEVSYCRIHFEQMSSDFMHMCMTEFTNKYVRRRTDVSREHSNRS